MSTTHHPDPTLWADGLLRISLAEAPGAQLTESNSDRSAALTHPAAYLSSCFLDADCLATSSAAVSSSMTIASQLKSKLASGADSPFLASQASTPQLAWQAADTSQRLRRFRFIALHLLHDETMLHAPQMDAAEMEQRIAARIESSPFYWLLESAMVHPATLAVVDNETLTTSYMGLLLRAVALCRSFSRSGALDSSRSSPGRVAVFLANSTPVIDVHFAAAAAGCAVVNLNTHLVARELSYALRMSQPDVIMADAARSEVLRDALVELLQSPSRGLSPPAILWVGGVPAAAAAQLSELGVLSTDYEAALDDFRVADVRELSDALSQLPVPSAELPFQYYFTSGTTGNPKLVMLTRGAVVAHALGTIMEMRLHTGDVWLHVAPMFHLVDAFAIFGVTRVAGRHVISPSFNAADCLRLIEQERVTASNGALLCTGRYLGAILLQSAASLSVASTMLLVLAANPAAAFIDTSSLRILSCGGSPLLSSDFRRALSSFACELFISYGMARPRLARAAAI